MDQSRAAGDKKYEFNIEGSETSGWLPKLYSDTGGPNFPDDTLPRESLGILKSDTLANNCLIDRSVQEEPFGILDLSALDLGRESIGLFSINNPLFNRQFKDAERRTNLYSNDFNSPRSSLSQLLESTFEAHACISTNFGSPINSFNKAFRFNSINSHHSMSSKIENPSTSFSGNIDNNSNSIISLPLTLGVKNVPEAANTGSQSCIKEIDFGEEMDINELDNSVFELANLVEDNSSNREKYIIDSISEPDWPDIVLARDEEGSGPIVYRAESVATQIDRLLADKPAYLGDSMDIRNDGKVTSITSSAHTSPSIRKTSRVSQCSMLSVDQNVLRSIKELSDQISAKENLSELQKEEAQHHLRMVANIVGNDENQVPNSTNAFKSIHGHPQIKERRDEINKENTFHSAPIRSANFTGKDKDLNVPSISIRTSVPGRTALKNTTNSEASKFNKKSFGPLKKEPLRAILPIENMSKANISRKFTTSGTPEQRAQKSKENLRLSKTSTPNQQLKPLASSTPGCPQLNSSNKTEMKRSYSRSFSNQNTTPAASQKFVMRKFKMEGAELVRRNSDIALVKEKETLGLSEQQFKHLEMFFEIHNLRRRLVFPQHPSRIVAEFSSLPRILVSRTNEIPILCCKEEHLMATSN